MYEFNIRSNTKSVKEDVLFLIEELEAPFTALGFYKHIAMTFYLRSYNFSSRP